MWGRNSERRSTGWAGLGRVVQIEGGRVGKAGVRLF